jgi:hypothetical protein
MNLGCEALLSINNTVEGIREQLWPANPLVSMSPLNGFGFVQLLTYSRCVAEERKRILAYSERKSVPKRFCLSATFQSESQ